VLVLPYALLLERARARIGICAQAPADPSCVFSRGELYCCT